MSESMDYIGPYGYGTPPPWADSGNYGATVSNITAVYPCDRGVQGGPRGYHRFAAGGNGVVVCEYCGKQPN